jgi:hypothetical protein
MNRLELVVFHPFERRFISAHRFFFLCNRRMSGKITDSDVPDEVRTKKIFFRWGFSALSVIWRLASCADIFTFSVTKRLVWGEDDVCHNHLRICRGETVKRREKCQNGFNGEIKELKAEEPMRICPPEEHAWAALQQNLLEPRCLEIVEME